MLPSISGGLPDPIIQLNATASATACSLAATEQQLACHNSKVIGFNGFELQHSGTIVRGMPNVDALVFTSPGFLELSDSVRGHIVSEARRIAATCATLRRSSAACAASGAAAALADRVRAAAAPDG